jgi:hypothetical protein
MPASHVLAPHDDGTWRLAQLLDQYRGPQRLAVRRHVLDGARDAVPAGVSG